MGNTVTLTFAGDSKSLEKTFDKVGKGAQDMAKDLDKSSRGVKDFGGAMDKAADVTDRSEGKFMGAADVLDGLGGAFGLPTEGATTLMRSFGDLSGGFTALSPLISGFGKSLMSLAFNPVVIGIAALAAGLYLLWNNSETFRDIITAAFEAVKKAIGPVIDTIGNVVGFIGGLFKKNKEEVADSTDAVKDRLAELNTALEAQRQKWQDWKDKVTESINGILSPLSNAREQSKIGFDEINANLLDNTAFFQGWINNLQTLTNRGFGALASKMFELGPTAEKAVGEMVGKSDTELNKMVSNFGAAGTSAQAAFSTPFMLTESLGAISGAGQHWGAQFKTGFDKGLGRINVPVHRVGPAIPGLAEGGPVGAGRPYVVGERGPELFVPAQSGTIVPNLMTGGGGHAAGGTTFITHINAGAIVTENQLADLVQGALLRKQQRTGSLGFV